MNYDEPLSDDEVRAQGYTTSHDGWKPTTVTPITQSVTIGAEAATTLSYVLASDETPERLRWLWKQWLPLGCVCLLAGMPDQGKSTLAIDIAARASRGELDGDLQDTPSNSILVMQEDPRRAAVIPRLIAAGAELERVAIVTFGGEDEGLNLSTDMERLQATIEEHKAALVVIDPILAYMPIEVDAHKDQHARSILSPLATVAEKTGATILAIMHLNKSDHKEVLARVSASIGFVGAARALLMVGPDNQMDAETAHVLAVPKSNLTLKPTALRYETVGESVPIEGEELPAETSRIVWTGYAEGITPADLLYTSGGNDEPGALDEAVAFLREMLEDGAQPSKEIDKEARAIGITPATLRRAKRKLGAKSTRPVNPGPWYVKLP